MNRSFFLFSVLFLLFTLTGIISAQNDDITLMGNIFPIYRLDNPFSKSVVTSDNDSLTVTVSDVAVESERVLIRFYTADLPESWKDKISDDTRLYGSYLPVAEIVLNDGSILTPSSASKYSLLEYSGRLIIGGLLVFPTDKIPMAFYLNFNQIPFDTKPLSEGFSEAVILKEAENKEKTLSDPVSDIENDLELTLTAAAQTSELTMLQPAVHLRNSNDILSKFGWISIKDRADGRKFAVTRGNLYGFNLTDDSYYAPAHAYIFKPIHENTTLDISMDYAYVVRSFMNPYKSTIDLKGKKQTVLLENEDFLLTVSAATSFPEEDKIRVYIQTNGKQIADISFLFPDLSYVITPAVSCGFENETASFACDIFFNDISFPTEELTVEVDAIEYRLDGPWHFEWTPVRMDEPDEKPDQINEIPIPYTYDSPRRADQPDPVQNIFDIISNRELDILNTPGWIHESYELVYEFTGSNHQDLIQVDQFEQYLTHYISDAWYSVGDDSKINEIVTITRDAGNKKIYSAQVRKTDSTLDLLHALLSKTSQPVELSFNCFSDFKDLAESSAVFDGYDDCGDAEEDRQCLYFYQSLSGIPDSRNSQNITFEFDKNTGFLLTETIAYRSAGLELAKTTLALEKRDSLPEEILLLMDAIK